MKPVPMIVTSCPMTPLAGVNELIEGAVLKSVALAAVPPGVVTVILPEVAPTGTVDVIDMSLSTVKLVAPVPLNFTADAPVKYVPVMVTVSPTDPLEGVKEMMVGG